MLDTATGTAVRRERRATLRDLRHARAPLLSRRTVLLRMRDDAPGDTSRMTAELDGIEAGIAALSKAIERVEERG